MVRGGGSRGGGGHWDSSWAGSHHSSSWGGTYEGTRRWNSYGSTIYGYGGSSTFPHHDDSEQCDCCERGINRRLRGDFESSTWSLCCFYCWGASVAIAMILLPMAAYTDCLAVPLAFDPGETRMIDYGVPLFVQGLSLQQVDDKIDVYILEETPPLEKTPRSKDYTFKDSIELAEESYENFSHWLNKGSVIDLSFSVSHGAVHMYLLKSQGSFDRFKDSFYDGARYVVWSAVSNDIYRYSSSSKVTNVRMSIRDDDLYTIILLNEAWRRGAVVSLEYTLQRTRYLISSNAQPVCGTHAQQFQQNSDRRGKQKKHEVVYERETGDCFVPIHIDTSMVLMLTSPPSEATAVVASNGSASSDGSPVATGYNIDLNTGSDSNEIQYDIITRQSLRPAGIFGFLFGIFLLIKIVRRVYIKAYRRLTGLTHNDCDDCFLDCEEDCACCRFSGRGIVSPSAADSDPIDVEVEVVSAQPVSVPMTTPLITTSSSEQAPEPSAPPFKT